MKINRWISLAAIAILVLGAMGIVSFRVFASTFGSAVSQDCGSEIEENDVSESVEAEDTDLEACGQQGEDANGTGEINEQDQSDETAPASTGITADEAQALVEAANPGAATLAVEFDREGGKDIWEVELDNGLDVKVDAATGEVLYSEQGD